MTKLIIAFRNFAKVPKSRNFLSRVNKKQNIDIYTSTSNGGERIYLIYISFLWPPVDAALSIFNLSVLVQTVFFGKQLMKTNKIAINAES